MSRISYSAVVLDESSSNRLEQEFASKIPDGWKLASDHNKNTTGHKFHMTIKMGGLPDELKSEVGKSVTLTSSRIGEDDRAYALEVTGDLADLAIKFAKEKNKDKIPHITIAFTEKPFHSNTIPELNWKSPPNTIRLTGTIQEIAQG